MSKMLLSVAAAATLLAVTVPASAQTRGGLRVGGLTCQAGPSVGFIVGSRQDLRCVFRSTAGNRYIYSGTINRAGLDLGFTAAGRMFWAVFAPSKKVGHGSLRGTYVGASADASFGLGAGGNILMGGSNNTISLQPVSVTGQAGVNLAVGVARLTLR